MHTRKNIDFYRIDPDLKTTHVILPYHWEDNVTSNFSSPAKEFKWYLLCRGFVRDWPPLSHCRCSLGP